MIPALGRFVEALRREGVAVSPAELIDAARAVEAVGLEERRRFRAALAATLAKDRRAHEVFGRLFDSFFATPARGEGRGKGKSARAGSGEKGGSGSGGGPKARRDPSRDPKPVPGSRPSSSGRKARPEGKSLRRILADAREGGTRTGSRLRRVHSRRSEGNQEAAIGPRAADDPLRADLSARLASEEERRLASVVPRLIQELRLRSGRRLRRSKRGRIWTRQIFRENLSRGGVPFVLPYRRPRPRHPRVVVLVDVSGSVARAAAYFLWMALEFLRPGRRARVLAFVDRPIDATDAVARWGRSLPAGASRTGAVALSKAPRRRGKRSAEGIVRGGVAFADLLDSLPGLDPDAPSDYGRMFHALLTSHHRPSGRETVLVILGDARTNRFDPLPWAFEELASRCGAVLWLVPEPESRWGTGDSALGSYLGSVDVVVESSDLRGLSKGLAELLRRL